MEKDSGHYCYDPYPTVSKQNTNSLKRDVNKKKKEERSCCCFGKKTRRKGKAFLAGLATNLGKLKRYHIDEITEYSTCKKSTIISDDFSQFSVFYIKLDDIDINTIFLSLLHCVMEVWKKVLI